MSPSLFFYFLEVKKQVQCSFIFNFFKKFFSIFLIYPDLKMTYRSGVTTEGDIKDGKPIGVVKSIS
jgi:hypothetical protein